MAKQSQSQTKPYQNPPRSPRAPRFDAIPSDLRELAQWVVWKIEDRAGKPTKVPYNARTGKYARSTDRATWAPFQEAVRTWERGGYDGIGFVFDGAGIVGIDIDHCIEEDGALSPLAQEVIGNVGSYAEISPSGRGMHCFAHIAAPLPPGGRKSTGTGLEVYETGRFFTVTGNHIAASPSVLTQADEAIRAVHARIFPAKAPHAPRPAPLASPPDLDDAALLDKARASANGAKFMALFDRGDTAGYGAGDNEGHSEADLALCCMLAFWTGKDTNRIDRLFQRSALYRAEKWDRAARQGETYGAGTIRIACENASETYDPARRSRPRPNIPISNIVDGQDEQPDEQEKTTQARALIGLARAADFFRATDGALFARIPVGTHRETWPISGKGGFRLWLSQRYYAACGSPPSANALAQALEWCEGQAQYHGGVQQVYVRVAEYNGAIYIDLADEDWQAIEITATGWRVVAIPPVAFRRPGAMRPMPPPTRGGSIDELRRFINIDNDEDWQLIVGWLVGAFHPRGPYPIMCIHGERGSAKSSATRYLRGIVDPAWAPARTAPDNDRDLAVAAHNSWVLALENLSHIPAWLSDGLCRIATGAGHATRTNYTDSDETVFQARRPIIINGIEELATRGDLLDRAIIVTLPAIPDHLRCTESELDRAYEAIRPRVLGALFDAIATALRDEATVQLQGLPRMADFARWVTAAESALHWLPGAFMAVYSENREAAVGIEVEASPLAQSVIAFLRDRFDGWVGSATELETELKQYRREDADSRYSNWPRNARALSGALKRIAPALRSEGTDLIWRKSTNGARLIELRKAPPPVPADVAAPLPIHRSDRAPAPADAAHPTPPRDHYPCQSGGCEGYYKRRGDRYTCTRCGRPYNGPGAPVGPRNGEKCPNPNCQHIPAAWPFDAQQNDYPCSQCGHSYFSYQIPARLTDNAVSTSRTIEHQSPGAVG